MENKKYIKDSVLKLHYEGFTNKEIATNLNIMLSTVTVMVSKYTKSDKSKNGYFNIHELDCWIFPSKSKSQKYDSR